MIGLDDGKPPKFPEVKIGKPYDQFMYEACKWREDYKAKFETMDFEEWFNINIANILHRFKLHSHSGIKPEEALQYFVEKEVLDAL